MKGPNKLYDIKGDVAIVLEDGETWSLLSGVSLVIAPPGALIDNDTELREAKPITRMDELGPDEPYGVIALDTLLRCIPLSKLLEYRTATKKAPPPEPAERKEKKKHGSAHPRVRRRA